MSTKSPALKARKAKAYCFQSIRAGVRRPSSRKRNIGRRRGPCRRLVLGDVERRNIDHPSGNERRSAGRRPRTGGARRMRSPRRRTPFLDGKVRRNPWIRSEDLGPDHGVSKVDQRQHHANRGQVQHDGDSLKEKFAAARQSFPSLMQEAYRHPRNHRATLLS